MHSYLITKRSLVTGLDNTLLIWLTDNQWQAIQPFLKGNGEKGELAKRFPLLWQRAAKRTLATILPDHNPAERTFLLDGTTREERRMLLTGV